MGFGYSLHASVPGRKHIARNALCQDAHGVTWVQHWGIAVVADGAGSCLYAREGAEMAVTFAIDYFRFFVEFYEPEMSEFLEDESRWRGEFLQGLQEIQKDMQHQAAQKGYLFAELSATLIVSIFSTSGILLGYVGDGRVGYKNLEGEWRSLMSPFKGEYANETIFITSHFDMLSRHAGVAILPTQWQALVMLSDGCEASCYLLHAPNEDGQIVDRNLPYPGFFEPLLSVISSAMCCYNEEEMLALWRQLLVSGNDRLQAESDDKTMILVLPYRAIGGNVYHNHIKDAT